MHTDYQLKCTRSSQIICIIDDSMSLTQSRPKLHTYVYHKRLHTIALARLVTKDQCAYIYLIAFILSNVCIHNGFTHKRTSTQKKDMDVQLHLVSLGSSLPHKMVASNHQVLLAYLLSTTNTF